MWEKYGRAYPPNSGETCNISAYQCPHCKSPDRARLYAMYLQKWFSKQNPSKNGLFLDFAPSKSLSVFIQQKIQEKTPLLDYKTADLMMGGADFRLDISNMPEIGNEAVDFFLCSHVLEHVPDDRAAMRELKRILKPDGQGILVVPISLALKAIDEDPTVTDVAERWRRFGQDDHVRAYSRQGFLDRVREAGFDVLELDKRYFGRYAFWLHGIAQKSVLYVVKHGKNGQESTERKK